MSNKIVTPRYLPFLNGVYEVAPGLSLLSADRGFGTADAKLWQIDESFDHYHTEKTRARDENIDKYYPPHQLPDHEVLPVIRLIASTLAREYPQYFKLSDNEEVWRLECLLTDEILTFDDAYFDRHNSSLLYNYKDGLDALCGQIQEDIAIWKSNPHTPEHLALVHLCFPNHWSPADKLGKGFNEVHHPVGDWHQQLEAKAETLVKTMLTKGPFVRFAWGLATDQRLNHHPLAPPHKVSSDWHGRRFERQNPELYVRVERQCLSPLPMHGLSLFSIRTYFYDVKELSASECQALMNSLLTMTPETLAYKGLQNQKEILEYLASLHS